MKRLICITLAVLLCMSALLAGCSGSYDKSPDDKAYSKIRWISPDYSFRFVPSDDCKGKYYYNDKGYDMKLEFESTRLTAYDTANGNKELFFADWKYEDGDEHLFIYNISFNTQDYKEFKNNYMEFIQLKQEKLE